MKIIKALPKNIRFIIKVVKKGGVVIFPTDTVYGILVDARSKEALARVFEIKKRDSKKTLAIFVADIKAAKKIAKVNKKQEELLGKLWPGAITVIFEAKKRLPSAVSKYRKVGLRIPKYKFLNDFLKKINIPIAQTSANISGEPSILKSAQIKKIFRHRECQPDLIIDGGDLKKSRPSTVISLVSFKILREGQVSKEEVSKTLGLILK